MNSENVFADIIEKMKQGDVNAFEKIVFAFEKPLYRLAYHMTGNRDDALDVVQEIFLKVMKNIHRYDPRYPFHTWIYTLASRTCISFLRKRNFRQKIRFQFIKRQQETSEYHSRDTESILEWNELVHHIQKALTTLPPRTRVAFVLREFEGLSTADIARILHISEVTVRRLCQNARRKLMERLDHEQEIQHNK